MRPHAPNCSSCCTCPAPQFAYAQRAASKSKCGVVVDTTSTVWIYYLARTRTVGITYSDYAEPSIYEVSGSGSFTQTASMTSADCVQTNTYSGSFSLTESAAFGTDGEGSPDDIVTASQSGSVPDSSSPNLVVTGTWQYEYGSYASGTIGPNGYNPLSGGWPTPYWSRLYSTSTSDTGTVGSSPYSTSSLQAVTVSALPAWGPLGAFEGGFPGVLASAELSANEASYSIMDSKYQLAHPIPPGGTYKLAWLERFSPDGGGAPIDTPQSYTWDGTRPSGYNPADASTWPKTPTFEVDHPASNGATTFHSLTVDCGAGPTTLFS